MLKISDQITRSDLRRSVLYRMMASVIGLPGTVLFAKFDQPYCEMSA